MAPQNPNMENIIRKLLSDPRIAQTITTVLIDILSEMQRTEQTTKTQPAPTPTVKVTDWSSKSNNALRTAYAYRRKRNIAIEPELNTELATRFPGYDATQQKFTGRGGKRKSKATVTNTPVTKTPRIIDWSKKSNAALRTAYAYRRKRNIAIEPELNTELATRFPGYDATQQKFTGRGGKRKSKAKKVRIINWADKTDDILRQAYKHRTKTTGIDDALNTELARRFPGEYDASTRKFIKSQKVHDFATKNVQKSETPRVARTPVPKTTVQKSVSKTAPVNEPATLSVTLKPVKQSLDAAFYDVYVNGKRILHNHGNTELKLFCDGTLLGVYGIVTNNKDLPQRPLWMIYDTDLNPHKWGGYDKFSGYSIYTKNIYPSATGANATLSDRRTVLLDTERLKRLAGVKRFEIVR